MLKLLLVKKVNRRRLKARKLIDKLNIHIAIDTPLALGCHGLRGDALSGRDQLIHRFCHFVHLVVWFAPNGFFSRRARAIVLAS